MGARNTKEDQLGCNAGTATSRLKKIVMFDLVKRLGLDTCFRCNKKIEFASELSIDHKVNWLHAENPIDLFYDLGNVAFSHLLCNTKFSRRKSHVAAKSKSGFKGVYLNATRKKKYAAQVKIRLDGKVIKFNLGRYLTAEEAAKAYDDKITALLGNEAVTNAKLGLFKEIDRPRL